MAQSKMQELADFGQSIWLDYISRSLIETGKLKSMIAQGLRGMTSNPTIFDKAVSASADYDKQIAALKKKGKSIFEVYDDLTVKDIQEAADLFKPVYEKTHRGDGYVSIQEGKSP
jgi:transaldolase